MMTFRTTFFFALLFLCFSTARAAPFTNPNDLQTYLQPSEVTIDDLVIPTAELNSFYAAQNYRPSWNFTSNRGQKNADAFVTSLEALIAWHGLRREDYPLADLRKLIQDDDRAMEREVLITDTLLHFAHDLHGDTVNLSILYPGWTFKRAPLDIPAALAKAVSAHNLNDLVIAAAPKNQAYLALAQALARYREIESSGGWKEIPSGPIIRVDDKSARIPQIRARLRVEGYGNFLDRFSLDSTTYDSHLAKAVKDFQERNGQNPDGDIGPATLRMMNIPVATRLEQIRANMERWRHMPDDFPSRYAEVNIASATIHIKDDGKDLYTGPVVIGKVTRKTPFIQSTIRSMIINPAWHVPKKIAQKDILPKLRKDPHYLEKLGFVISGSEDDPYGTNIDWASMSAQEFNFHLRQSPGDLNSLGRLKFDFANDFAVYMHGTPHQELFDRASRTRSSGCIRLRDPEEVATILLSGNKKTWDTDAIETAIESEKTQWVPVQKPMPLYVVYWTVFTDENGDLNFRYDAYNYDHFLIEAMREPAMLDDSTSQPDTPSPSTPRP